MDTKKKRRLEAAGWRVGTVAEFLGLTDAESALLELHVDLSRAIRQLRGKRGMTQMGLAKKLESSQSRVAKMEASDPTVSVVLMIRGLLSLGATRRQIAKVIAG
jgi:ribosome-binding protein aMBF1 (putative translation factor)